MPKARGLTPKQVAFVAEYLVDLNATQAAIRAGYSAKTAGWIGPQLLGKTHIATSIEAGKAARSARVQISADAVLRELGRIAFADPRKVMEWGPDGVRLLSSEDLSEDDAAAVAEVSESTSEHGGSIRMKKHDKVKALELLGRHLGMFVERHELSGKNGGPLRSVGVTVNATPKQLRDAVAAALQKV